MNNWVSVFVSKDRIRAELIKNELINHGINAVILDKIDGNYPMVGTAAVNVPETQEEEARKYIDESNLDGKEA